MKKTFVRPLNQQMKLLQSTLKKPVLFLFSLVAFFAFAASAWAVDPVYVDDNFSNPTIGQDPDGGGPATDFGTDSFATIQEGIDAVTAGGTVYVAEGSYAENVTADKAVTLLGANQGVGGCGTRGSESTISGGVGTALTISADDVVVDGFALEGMTGIQAYAFKGFSLQNNLVTGGAIGIDIRNVTGTGTPAFTVSSNKVVLTAQEILGNATAGVVLAGLTGTAPMVRDNCLEDAFSGYVLYAVNTSPTLAVTGGDVAGSLQGVVVLNVDPGGTIFLPSSFVVDDVSMSGFTGTSSDPNRNFHAGIYIFTGGSSGAAAISGTVTNTTIEGTGKPGPDSAGVYVADFSTGASVRQQISVLNCTIQNNENRGVYSRGTNAEVSLSGCNISGNGFDAYNTGGNFGFGVIAVGSAVTITESFVVNPASSTDEVYALFLGATGSLTSSNCSVLNSANPSGFLASGAMTASNNWWGTIKGPTHSSNPGGNAGDTVGAVVFSPWLGDGTDTSGAAGFQPNASPIYYRPVSLAFATQPGGALTNSPLEPQPEVEALNELGARALQFEEAITLAIASNPGSGTLSGSNPENAAAGLATFTDLSINNAGVGYTLQATSPGLTPATSDGFDVDLPAGIDTQPSSLTIGAGSNAVFTVVASGTSLGYQWRKGVDDLVNGGNISGTTSASLTLSGVSQSDAASDYTVYITNASSSITSAPVSLTVIDPPSITVAPLSRTNFVGTTASFSVTAGGTAPLQYRWRFEGVDLPDETLASLNVLNVQESDAGDYTVVITNLAGSVTSAPAVLSVHYTLTATAGVGGTVSKDPDALSYDAGSSVDLTATATPGFIFTGWSGDESGTANPLSVTMTTNKTVAANFMGPGADIILDNIHATFVGTWTNGYAQPGHYGDDYRMTLPGTIGETARATYRPEIVRPGNYDVYIQYPQKPNRSTNSQWLVSYNGGSVLVSVNQRTNGLGSWFLITTNKPFVAGTNQFVRVSNDTGSGESGTNTFIIADAVRFVYSANNGIAPTFVTHPQSQTLNQTSNVTFTVSATGTGTLAYQWRFNNEPISGATDSSYTRTNLQASDAGNYAVVVIHDTGSAISSNAVLSVNLPPTITAQPANKTVIEGQSHTFTVGVTGTAPLFYQWQFEAEDIPGATDSSYLLSVIETGEAGNYSVIISNIAGVATSASALLTVTDDLQLPRVSIISPANGGKVANAVITMTGAAKDNVGVAQVKYVFNGITNTASGTTSWSAVLTNTPGTNIVFAWSVDMSGQESLRDTHTFYYNSTNFLTLNINGNGQVSGVNNGQGLLVGRTYSATASIGPGTNWVFTNWTGDVTSTNHKLSFIMQSNMVLTANFITNPFTPVAGKYNGLFHELSEVKHESAGFFQLALSQKASYTGKLLVDGNTVTFSGKFNLSGQSSLMLSRAKLGKSPLQVSLGLDWSTTNETISGTISDGNWTSDLTADRAIYDAIYNPTTNHLGRYTMLIPPPIGSPVSSPGGYGYALVSNSVAGNIRILRGALGDGTVISQSVPISKFGQWPLYVPAYKQKTYYTNGPTITTNATEMCGSLLGWVTFTNIPTRTLVGTVNWIKTERPPTNTYYADGFTNQIELVASGYVEPAYGTRLLNLTNGLVIHSEGNLILPLTNNIVLKTNNGVTINSLFSVAALKFSFVPKTGLLKGTFVHPDNTNKVTAFSGAVLQEQNYGAGHFLGADQSGAVTLQEND